MLYKVLFVSCKSQCTIDVRLFNVIKKVDVSSITGKGFMFIMS